MNQEQQINSDEDQIKKKLEFISQELLQKKQLKTINLSGGKGAFGFVLFVEDVQNSSNKYAIKVQSLINQSTGTIDQITLKRCKEEAEIMRNCKHKNIVEIHSDYEIGVYHFIQMALCKYSFANWIEENKEMIDNQVFFNFASQILDGLEFLHDKDYVLRDLSVRNILLTTEGVVKLCDFGLAKKYDDILQSQIFSTQGAKGVFFYFPPELFDHIQNKQQVKQTKKGDIWAFGVCLSLIGGANLLQYMTWNINFQVPHSPRISEEANRFVKFILNKNPFDRPSIQQIRKIICDYQAYDQFQTFTTSDIDQNQQKTNKIERIIDFQFMFALKLLDYYKILLKNNVSNNDILITLGYIEISYNFNNREAKKYFKQALQNNQNDLDAYLGLCECIMSTRKKQKFKQLIEQLESQISEYSQYWRQYYYLASFYYQTKEYNKSEKYCNLSMKLNKDSSEVLSLSALLIFQKNKDNKEQVLQLLEQSHFLNQTNHPDINIRRGKFQIKLKNYQKAMSYFEQILQLGITSLAVYLNLLKLYSKLNDQQQFALIKQLLLEKYSTSYVVYQKLGQLEQDYELKKEYLIRSLDIYPFNKKCIQKLAEIIDQNDVEKIIECFKKIIDSNSDEIQIYVNVGDAIRIIAKDDINIIFQLHQALQLDKLNFHILLELAKFYYGQKEKLKSLEIYYKIKDFCGDDFFVYTELGKLEMELRCHKNSIKAYEKAIEINDQDIMIKIDLASEYIENYEYEKAITYLNNLIKQTENNSFNQHHHLCYLLIGKAQYKNRSFQKALGILEKCIDYEQKSAQEAKIYHLKCQIRISENNKFNQNLKFQDSVSYFFRHLNLMVNKKQQELDIENYYLENKNNINNQDLFIIAQTLYEFYFYELSSKFFKKLIEIEPEQIESLYYLGEMENLYIYKIIYFNRYLELYSRDKNIISNLAIFCKYPDQKLKYYEMLVQIDSNDIQSLSKLCELINPTSKLSIYYVNHLLSIDPNNKDGLNLLIHKLTLNLEIQDWEKYFNEFVAQSKDSIEIALKIAKNQYISEHQKINCYELVLKINPKQKETLEDLMQIIQYENQKDKYLRYIENLGQLDPSNYLLKRLTLETKQLFQQPKIPLEEQTKYIQIYKKIYSKNTQMLQELAYNLYRKKLQNELYDCLKLMEEIEPNNQFAIDQLADYYTKQKNSVKMLEYYEKQLQINKDKIKILEKLGDFYFGKKENEKSKQYYLEYIKIEQTTIKIYYNLGKIEQQQKNYNQSINYFRKCQSLGSSTTNISQNIGMNYYHLEEYKKSEKSFQECILINERYGYAYFMIGDIYLNKHNKKQESIFYFKRAIEHDSTLEDAFYYLGMAFNNIGYNYHAKKSYEELVFHFPTSQRQEYCRKYIEQNEQAEFKIYQETPPNNECSIF